LQQWNFHGPLILELADSGAPPERIMERARAAREYLRGIAAKHGGKQG